MAKKTQTKKRKKKLPKSVLLRLKIVGTAISVAALVFLPTTIIFAIGMMPTVAAIIIDKSHTKFLTLSVGILNFSGCLPFVFYLWEKGHSIDNALNIGVQAQTISVIYFIASLGYVIDYAISGIVSNILLQKAQGRKKRIEKKQKELIERWGTKVNGKTPLDEFGFPQTSS